MRTDEEARAEAEQLRVVYDEGRHTGPLSGVDGDAGRNGLLAVARWERTRPITDEEVVRAATVLRDATYPGWVGRELSSIWIAYARAALEAARGTNHA